MGQAPPNRGSGAAFEIEFVVRDGSDPFVAITEEYDCTFELGAMVPRDGDRYAEFVNVIGARPSRIEAAAMDHEGVQASVLRSFERGGLFEFLISGGCPAHCLAELGALPRQIEGSDGVGRIVAEVPSQYEPATIIEEFLAQYPEATLARKREKESVDPIYTGSTFQQLLEQRLTDRQLEVIRTAFEAGYYEWPRECTGEELAEELGISSATFSEHIAAAERKLLSVSLQGTD